MPAAWGELGAGLLGDVPVGEQGQFSYQGYVVNGLSLDTEFEQVVREYKLSPDQYLRSTRLREWARRNKNSKYIPEPLLEAWGFEIESTL